MQLIRGLYNLNPDRHRPTVLTLGNFDGVHLGHQAILRRLVGLAREAQAEACVLLFEPTPREYFAPHEAPSRLMRLGEKLPVMCELGVDQVVCLRFDERIARMTPEEFATRLLVEGLGVRHVLVGQDVRYGYQRRGTLQTLTEQGRQYGFEVSAADTVEVHGERVSSTRVRHCIRGGDFERACDLLGRPYTMTGRVIHGQKLGRTLGYPTVNIPVRRRRSPVAGIYAVRVRGVPGEAGAWPGVASIGTRPTVDGDEPLLEVHLFDFAGDLYGTRLHVEFVGWLRREERFDTLEALIAQMDDDARRARLLLSAPPGGHSDDTAGEK